MSQKPNGTSERFQGVSGQIIAGIDAALGFGLVTWWQTHDVGPTLIMAALAFLVGFAASYWSRRGRR